VDNMKVISDLFNLLYGEDPIENDQERMAVMEIILNMIKSK